MEPKKLVHRKKRTRYRHIQKNFRFIIHSARFLLLVTSTEGAQKYIDKYYKMENEYELQYRQTN